MDIRDSYRLKFSIYLYDPNYFQDMLDEENTWAWVYIAEYFTCKQRKLKCLKFKNFS